MEMGKEKLNEQEQNNSAIQGGAIRLDPRNGVKLSSIQAQLPGKQLSWYLVYLPLLCLNPHPVINRHVFFHVCNECNERKIKISG